MMKHYFLIIDQGTSGTKSFLFNEKGEVCFSEKIKHLLDHPKPLFVECDATLIADAMRKLIALSIRWADKNDGTIITAGMAFQRSTFLFWDKETARPLTPALSWQDNRAHNLVEKFNAQKQLVYRKTGIPLSGHFGALKYVQLIKDSPELEEKVKSGNTFFGPLSSYLTHVFTGTAVVDHSIAGRSQLFSLDSLNWDESLCELFHVNISSLPPLVPTIHKFGDIAIDNHSIPLSCVIGDQQAALMGQGFSSPGTIAINLGTSGSVQCYSGGKPSFIKGLISNLFWSSVSEHHFLTEGTINACNSLFYWLEDYLNIPHEKMKWDERCEAKKSSGVLVPGFTGITSPYWVQPKETIFYNLDGVPENEIIRAGMESIGFLIHDILHTLMNWGVVIHSIQAGGGGARKPLLQFIADLLGVTVKLSKQKDKTALGVFQLLFKNQLNEFPKITQSFHEEFVPKMTDAKRIEKLDKWNKALVKAGVKL